MAATTIIGCLDSMQAYDDFHAVRFASYFINRANTLNILHTLIAQCVSERIFKIGQCLTQVHAQFHMTVQLTEWTAVTVNEIDKLLLIGSAPTKTCELDPVPTWLVKDIHSLLSPFIALLFNASLISGCFRSKFKQAVIRSIRKRPKSLITAQYLPKSPRQNHRRCVTKSPNERQQKSRNSRFPVPPSFCKF